MNPFKLHQNEKSLLNVKKQQVRHSNKKKVIFAA